MCVIRADDWLPRPLRPGQLANPLTDNRGTTPVCPRASGSRHPSPGGDGRTGCLPAVQRPLRRPMPRNHSSVQAQPLVEADRVVAQPLVRLGLLQAPAHRGLAEPPSRRWPSGSGRTPRTSSGSSEGSTSTTSWSSPASRHIRVQASAVLDDVLGPAVQHVALPGHALVEGEDAAPGDVLGEDPADRELQIPLDAPTGRRQQDPVEAGPAERVAGHRRRPEDGTGVRADHVLPWRPAPWHRGRPPSW